MTRVILEDETLRDGLQTVGRKFDLAEKQDLFRQLVDAGLKRIQVGSFVHPKIVPQMADTDELVRLVNNTPGVLVTGLILNERGLTRALDCGLKHLSMSVSVSDLHSRRNANIPAREALASMVELVKQAVSKGVTVRAGAQCAFGCVYQGRVPEDDVLEAARQMVAAGASEVNLADTTGMANPVQIRRLVERMKKTLPKAALSLHLHDTRGLGLANMLAGFECGVEIFDVATGGLGGCPFVKGAAGNVPTEDAVNMFEQMGVDTGVNLESLGRVVDHLEKMLGNGLPGHMARVIKFQRDS